MNVAWCRILLSMLFYLTLNLLRFSLTFLNVTSEILNTTGVHCGMDVMFVC